MNQIVSGQNAANKKVVTIRLTNVSPPPPKQRPAK